MKSIFILCVSTLAALSNAQLFGAFDVFNDSPGATECKPRDVGLLYQFTKNSSAVVGDLARAIGKAVNLGDGNDFSRMTMVQDVASFKESFTLLDSIYGYDDVEPYLTSAFEESMIEESHPNINKALYFMVDKMFDEYEGMRPKWQHIPRVLVIVREGDCGGCDMSPQLKRLGRKRISVISVGTSKDIPRDFLLQLSGGVESQAFSLNSPDDLKDAISKIVAIVCSLDFAKPLTTTSTQYTGTGVGPTTPWPVTQCTTPRDVGILYHFTTPQSLPIGNMIKAVGRSLNLGPSDEESRIGVMKDGELSNIPITRFEQSVVGFDDLMSDRWSFSFGEDDVEGVGDIYALMRFTMSELFQEKWGMRPLSKAVPRVFLVVREVDFSGDLTKEMRAIEDLEFGVIAVSVNPDVSQAYLQQLTNSNASRIIVLPNPDALSSAASTIVDMICSLGLSKKTSTTLPPLWSEGTRRTEGVDESTEKKDSTEVTGNGTVTTESGDYKVEVNLVDVAGVAGVARWVGILTTMWLWI